jgi:outer membrane protein TolC
MSEQRVDNAREGAAEARRGIVFSIRGDSMKGCYGSAYRLTVLVASALITGCSVMPVALTPQEISDRVRSDQEKLYTAQEPISGPITSNEALARALKYNLDHRLKLMESALARGITDVSYYDMLPKLVADAGYTSRNNDSGGTSVSITTGQETLEPSTSEERSRYLAGAELSWNVLDFGLSYYRAKQAAEEYNIAEERRRRVQQNIVQDVRNAYWRALGAQRLLPQASAVAERAQKALEQSRQAEAAGMLPPAQALAYQRALLDALTLITLKRQELDFAQRELAALMNVPPGVDFQLADEGEPVLTPPPSNLDELELLALEKRPELREEDYKARVGLYESRKQLLSLFPSFNVMVGPRYDSNEYLYNNDWIGGTARLSWNLLRLAAAPDIQRTNETRQQTDEARRLALSMAVITQVRVGVDRYRLALADYHLADETARVDQRLAQISRAGVTSRVDTELEAVRTESRALVAQFQRHAAYASAQSAHARIYNSVGLDVLPDALEDRDVATLAKEVGEAMTAGERASFKISAADARESPPIRLKVSVPPGYAGGAVKAAVAKRLATQLPLAKGSEKAWRFVMRLVPETPGEGVVRARWEMALYDESNRRVHTASYRSSLPAEPTERAVQAFAEAAALSQVGEIHRRINLGGDEVASAGDSQS